MEVGVSRLCCTLDPGELLSQEVEGFTRVTMLAASEMPVQERSRNVSTARWIAGGCIIVIRTLRFEKQALH